MRRVDRRGRRTMAIAILGMATLATAAITAVGALARTHPSGQSGPLFCSRTSSSRTATPSCTQRPRADRRSRPPTTSPPWRPHLRRLSERRRPAGPGELDRQPDSTIVEFNLCGHAPSPSGTSPASATASPPTRTGPADRDGQRGRQLQRLPDQPVRGRDAGPYAYNEPLPHDGGHRRDLDPRRTGPDQRLRARHHRHRPPRRPPTRPSTGSTSTPRRTSPTVHAAVLWTKHRAPSRT